MTTKTSLFSTPDRSYEHISDIITHILLFSIWLPGLTSHFNFYQREKQTAQSLHQTEKLNLDLTGTGRSSIFSLTGQFTKTILYFRYRVGVRWGRQESRWVGDSHTHLHALSVHSAEFRRPCCTAYSPLSSPPSPCSQICDSSVWRSDIQVLVCVQPTPTQQPGACVRTAVEGSRSTQKHFDSTGHVHIRPTGQRPEVVSKGLVGWKRLITSVMHGAAGATLLTPAFIQIKRAGL